MIVFGQIVEMTFPVTKSSPWQASSACLTLQAKRTKKSLRSACQMWKSTIKETILAYEKEVLGIYLSGHPLERYRNMMEKMISARTIDFQPTDEDEEDENHVRDNQKVIIGGMIVEKNIINTKTNKVMAFLTVEDLLGTVEVMVFPRDYEKWQNMINEDARVFIQGRVSAEEDKASKLILEKVRAFSDIPKELWIQFESKADYSQKEKELLEDLRKVPGNGQCYCLFKRRKSDEKTVRSIPCECAG